MIDLHVLALASGNRSSSTSSSPASAAYKPTESAFLAQYVEAPTSITANTPNGVPSIAEVQNLIDRINKMLAPPEPEDMTPLERFHKAVEDARDPYAAWQKKLDEMRELRKEAKTAYEKIKYSPARREGAEKLGKAINKLTAQINALTAELAQRIEADAKHGNGKQPDGNANGPAQTGQMMGDAAAALFISHTSLFASPQSEKSIQPNNHLRPEAPAEPDASVPQPEPAE